MDPGSRSGEPRIWGSTVDPEQRLVRHAGGKETPESSLRTTNPVLCTHSLLQLRVGGGAVAAVAHGAAGHAVAHAAEHSRAAQLLCG